VIEIPEFLLWLLLALVAWLGYLAGGNRGLRDARQGGVWYPAQPTERPSGPPPVPPPTPTGARRASR
jgi:hypothetical protein